MGKNPDWRWAGENLGLLIQSKISEVLGFTKNSNDGAERSGPSRMMPHY